MTPTAVGQQYGMLTVIGITSTRRGADNKSQLLWHVQCECGATGTKYPSNVRAGRTRSCGDHGTGPQVRVNGIVTYAAIHNRLRSFQGPASQRRCQEGCGRMASEWSYDHTDPDELHAPQGYPYSLDLSRYNPRCKSCHIRLDRNYKAQR